MSSSHFSAVHSDPTCESQDMIMPEEAIQFLSSESDHSQTMQTIKQLNVFFSTNPFNLESEIHMQLFGIIMDLIKFFSLDENYNEEILCDSFRLLNYIIRSVKDQLSDPAITQEGCEPYLAFIQQFAEFLIKTIEESTEDKNVAVYALNVINYMIQDETLYDYVVNSKLINKLVSVVEQTDEKPNLFLEKTVLKCAIFLLEADAIFDELILTFAPAFLQVLPNKLVLENPLLVPYTKLIIPILDKIQIMKKQLFQNNIHIKIISILSEVPPESKQQKKLIANCLQILASLVAINPSISQQLNYAQLIEMLLASNSDISSNAATLLTQLLMNSQELVPTLIENGLYNALARMISSGKVGSKHSAMILICQLSQIEDVSILRSLVESDLVELIVDGLDGESFDPIIILSLKTLQHFLSNESRIGYDVKSLLMERGLEEILTQLSSNEFEEIAICANELLDTYFVE